MLVIDTFNRPDGALGGAWGAIGSCTDNTTANPGPYTGGIQLKNHAFAPIDNGTDVGLCAYNGQTFANDQWASAKIAAIAPFTSVVHITACSSAAGTSTYTYTLTSGAALIVTQQIYITGMTNAGNNSPTGGFNITALGTGTFSVANGSPGANESGSNGTGTTPSDSTCGVAVRVSADGKTGYLIEVGTNSGKVGNNGLILDHRVYCVELWKMVNGVGTSLALYQSGLLTTIPDSVGDVYTLSAIGTTLRVWKNGTLLLTATDASIASGSPGIGTWSIGGSGEWANPTNYQQGIGNSGTQWTNFIAGDGVFNDGVTTTQLGVDNFTRANESPLSQGGNWHQMAALTQLKIVSNLCEGVSTTANCWEVYNGVVLPQNQYAIAKLHSASGSGSQIVLVLASISAQTFYGIQIIDTLGNTGTFSLLKQVAGSNTSLSTSAGVFTGAVDDLFTVLAYTFGDGTTRIYGFQNGGMIIPGMDSSTPLTSGSGGLEISTTGTLTSNTFSNFAVGSLTPAFNNNVAGGSWMQRHHNFANKK